MREPPTNICPLMAIAGIGNTSAAPPICLGSRCAWWDFGGNECVMVTAAAAIGEVAANLEEMQEKAASDSNQDSG